MSTARADPGARHGIVRTSVFSWRRSAGLGVAVAVVAVLWTLAPWSLRVEEDVGLSLLFHLRGPRQAPPGVVVLAMDREAAQALGQPDRFSEWPRTLHARLIDGLVAAGVRVIAMDISFATPARKPEEDKALTAAVARAGRVVLLDLLEQMPVPDGSLHIARRRPPIPELAAAAAAHGPFPLPKTGAVRAYWHVTAAAGGLATLPVLAAQVYGRSAAAPLVPEQQGGADDARYLDFYGAPGSIPTVGFHQALAAMEDPGRGAEWLRRTFAGRAVFVGYSPRQVAEQDRLRDDYATVFTRADGLALSGVEIAATAFANMLERRAPSPLPMPAALALMLAWGLLLGALCTRLHGGQALAAVALAVGAYLAAAHWQFATLALWLPLVAPLLVQVPLALFAGGLWHAASERRERQRLGAVVDDVLSPVVVEQLLHRLENATTTERQMSGAFLMTDIEGFASVTERLPPTEAAHMMNRYFAQIFPPVERHGGSVSDIKGDSMLAFWLDTAPGPAVCRAACLAALEIADLTSRTGGPSDRTRLATRIGLHAGDVTLARIGASRHHEYRAVGDAVNTASRIEALSKHLGTHLLASDAALVGVEGMLTRPVGTFLLAGKSVPVCIHELVCKVEDASDTQRRLCAAFADALTAYRSRRWAEAADRWSKLLDEFPGDGPSRFYLPLARHCATDPPSPTWDGVVSMANK